MNSTIDILRGELERLYSLEDMTRMSASLLGLDPKEVGGDNAKATFARALAERCLEGDRVEALVDVMMFSKRSVDPRVFDAVAKLGKERLEPGRELGPFVVKQVVEESELAFVALCERDGKKYVVKVLKRTAMADRRAVQRFLTANRLVAAVEHPGLPAGLEAGEIADIAYVAYQQVDGEPVSVRFQRTGPQHFPVLKNIVSGILEALSALHSAGLVHGDLKLEHVLLSKAGQVTLVDFGGDKLRHRTVGSGTNGTSGGFLSILGSARTIAPEIVRGKAGDARADVYALGAMLYELVSGKPVFETSAPGDAAFAHVTKEVVPPSTRAPKGWVSKEVDEFILSLLDKDPARRPKDASAVLEALKQLDKPAPASATMTDERLSALIAAVKANPSDAEAAMALEQSVSEGADAAAVGTAFQEAAASITGESDDDNEAKKSMLFRAARTFDGPGKDKAKAEEAYAAIFALDPTDEVAAMSLEEVRKQLGKYEELIEMLLERSQAAPEGESRARAMAEIGRLYSTELDDADQALVAYTQALCEVPTRTHYVHEIERLAEGHQERWTEALASVTGALQGGTLSAADRASLLSLAAKWYEEKLGRADMALLAFQQVVAAEPSNEAALEGISAIYRRAQQWPELLSVLMQRVEAVPNSPKARDLRVEAAEVLEQRLNDAARARELYERVLADDPGHVKAGDAMARIAEKQGDFTTLVAILERRSEARRGVEKAEALLKVAEVYEDHLNDLPEATRRYEAALAIDGKNMSALKGLDRIYNRTGRYRELLDTLERQVTVAATPRQKVNLYERIAALHDEEFLDHQAAADTLEKILAIDSTNDGALAGLARHFRALDLWERVVAVYDRHANVVTDEARKVELLTQKARTLAEQVGSPDRAMKVFEEVLKLRPGHAGSLEALAQLKELTGDSHAALSAIEALAQKAETKTAKAEQWVRAGRLLEARGDRDGAIERYKMALEAHPQDIAAAAALRKAYTDRGDAGSVVGLIERELEFAEGDLAKGRLHAELARVHKKFLGDTVKAELSAKKATELDPSNAEALMILGDLAFESNRFVEAAKNFESLVGRIQALPKEDGTRILVRFIEAYGKSRARASQASTTELASIRPPAADPKLVAAVEQLQAFAPTDVEALAQAATVLFDHGDANAVYRMYEDLFKKHDAALRGPDRAEALYHLGESARRSGELAAAVAPLREVIKLDPRDPRPLRSLARIYDETGDWEEAIAMRKKRMDVVEPADRFDIYLEIGDIEFQKLNDRTRAEKTYAKALQERPDDRKLLTKLMQLYSEEKDWAKLVSVVTRLAEFVDDQKQRAKYMHTAATIAARHLNQEAKALEFLEKALSYDPSLTKAADEATELYRKRGDYAAVEKLLNGRIDAAKEAGDRDLMVKLLLDLGEVYRTGLKDSELAIDAFEAAQAFDPAGFGKAEVLAELYSSDPARHFDQAVEAHTGLLGENPYRVESYKQLRKLYTDAKKADPAWCLCQALTVLNLAGPDEEKFYRKHRSENAAAAQAVLTDDDWADLAHSDADATLTRIFAILQPVVARVRTQPIEALGYDPRYAIDPSVHPYPMSQTLYYAGGVLGMGGIRLFQNPNDPGALGFLHAHEPAIVLGRAALETQVSTQMLAFIVARHLAFFRPGLYVRQLIPTATGLKAWLFAAIKLCVPNFPVTPDLQGAVQEALNPMSQLVQGQQRDMLASAVSKLLQSGGAIDLKKWMAAVDMTADRAGFLLSHDLQSATECIRAFEADSTVAVKDRMKEIVLYGVSESYFQMRKKLSISIDS